MEEDYNELNARYKEMVAAGKSGGGVESTELMEVSLISSPSCLSRHR